MPLTRSGFLGAMTAAAYSRVLGANDPIQVGVVGYGLVGVLHAYNLKLQSDVDLAAVCDVYEPRLRQGLAACGTLAKGYSDSRRLLDDQDIQALMTLMACASGKDVYVEKPMTLFVQEGRWMVERYSPVPSRGAGGKPTAQREGLEFYGTKGSLKLSRNGFAVHPDMKTAPENLIPQIMGHPVGGPQLRREAMPVP